MPGSQKTAVIARFLGVYGILVVAGASLAQPVFAQFSPGAHQQAGQYQQPGYQQNQPYSSQQPYAPPPSTDPGIGGQQLPGAGELNNLVAPIALYPDPLLSQVLAASTYPLEIVEAQQWVQQHPGLRGPQLIDAARQNNWDPSVEALVVFPDVLALLNRDVQWTTDLGNAFLAQPSDVLNAVQSMRGAAQQSGRLASTPQQVVSNGQGAIQIQPADPNVMYVPAYNPYNVWGPPPAGVYPVLGYPAVYGTGFGVATLVGSVFTGLLSFGGWGWGLSWLTHSLFLNGLFLSHFGFGGGLLAGGYNHPAWAHNPAHRLGVPYSSQSVASRFGGSYGARSGGFSGYRASAAQSSGGWRTFGSRGAESFNARSQAYGGSGYSRSPAQSYSRSYAGPASSRSYGYSEARSGGRSYTSNPYTSNSHASNFSGSHSSASHFSAPRSSGGGGHSAPGHSSGSHSSGGHSGGHSGGGHHR